MRLESGDAHGSVGAPLKSRHVIGASEHCNRNDWSYFVWDIDVPGSGCLGDRECVIPICQCDGRTLRGAMVDWSFRRE